MKKVIFLCLLSLSVCLSKPAENQATPTPPVKASETKTSNATEPVHVVPVTTETQPAPNKEQAPPAKTEPEKVTLPPTPLPPKEAATSPPKETPSKESPKPTEDNKTQNKEEEKKEAPKPKEEAAPTKATIDTKVPTEKASSDKSEEGKAKEGAKPEADVTPKPGDTPKTTEAPKDAHIVQSRGFDGPSFIGGIILTLGLLAIGFMGFKYYKNQTERNYHTL